MKEEFRSVKDYENLYEVSNFGRVRSLHKGKCRYLIGSLSSSGYRQIQLCNGNIRKVRRIHQLVAMAFLGHEPCGLKLVVNHIDLDRLNNNVDNLEIVTNRENSNQKHLKSSSKYVGVNWNGHAKKWNARILINGARKNLGYFDCEIAASVAYNNELNKVNS